MMWASVMALASCSGKQDTPETASLVTTNIVIPAQLEFAAGETVQFSLRGKANLLMEDALVFKSVGGVRYNCPLMSLSDGTSFSVAMDGGLTSGYYNVYVRHGEADWYAGATQVSILETLPFTPDAGTTLYGVVTCEGEGVPGVVVSDGRKVTVTNAEGIYQMNSDKYYQYVFISVPSGYEAVSQGVLPVFYAATTQDASTLERKDFSLVKAPNDEFTLFVLGDLHLANRSGSTVPDDLKQFKDVADDLNATLSATEGRKYVLTLGDMTWDLYWYSRSYCFPEYLATVNTYFKDIQFFHTIGNHDYDMESAGYYDKSFRYTRDIAPTFYSFNIGKVHFVVLDNIDFGSAPAGESGRSMYTLDFNADQLSWLQKDLAYVDKSTPLVVTTHAPVFRPSTATDFKLNDEKENGCTSAFSILQDYDVHLLTGHTHRIFNYPVTEKFTEHNVGSVCASWWWTAFYSPGIHIGQDGSPGGYGIFRFTGTDMSHTYKAAGWGTDHQFHAYDMGQAKKLLTMDYGAGKDGFKKFFNAVNAFKDNDILINVWDWDPDWEITVTENGAPLEVTPVMTMDPLHIAAYVGKRFHSADSFSFATVNWNHFFKATASAGDSRIEITVTDRNGTVFTETFTRPKAFTVESYSYK